MIKRRVQNREDSFVLVRWRSKMLQTNSKRLLSCRRDARTPRDAKRYKGRLGNILLELPRSFVMTSVTHPRQTRRKRRGTRLRTREIHVPQLEYGCPNEPRWHPQRHRYAHGYAPLSRESLVL